MLVISSREFRENQKKYFDLVDSGEQVIVQRGKDTGTGQVEKLKHYTEETWSRRINDEHRLVYRIKEGVVVVLVLSTYGPTNKGLVVFILYASAPVGVFLLPIQQ